MLFGASYFKWQWLLPHPTYIAGNIYLGRSDGITYADDTGARAPVLVSTPANLDLGTYELTTRSYESLIK